MPRSAGHQSRNRGDTEGDVQNSTVFMSTRRFIVIDTLAALNAVKNVNHVIPVPRHGETQDRSSNHVFGSVSEDLLGCLVSAGNEAIQSGAGYGVIRRFDDRG